VVQLVEASARTATVKPPIKYESSIFSFPPSVHVTTTPVAQATRVTLPLEALQRQAVSVESHWCVLVVVLVVVVGGGGGGGGVVLYFCPYVCTCIIQLHGK